MKRLIHRFRKTKKLGYWWQDVVYPLVFFIAIFVGITFFVFNGQVHRRISTLVEHEFLSFALSIVGPQQETLTPLNSQKNIVIQIDQNMEVLRTLISRINSSLLRGKNLDIFIDTSLLSDEFTVSKEILSLAHEDLKIFMGSQIAKSIASDRVYEVDYCASVHQTICPFFSGAKKWNIQHLIEKYREKGLENEQITNIFYQNGLATNLGSNFPSYLLRIPVDKVIGPEEIGRFDPIEKSGNAYSIFFIQLVDSNSRPSNLKIPSTGSEEYFYPIQLWSGITALARSNSFSKIGSIALEWTIVVLFMLSIFAVAIQFGFLPGFTIFLLTLFIFPIFCILLLNLFNFYLPFFLIEYTLLMCFLGLGFFVSASESLMKWIESTQANLTTETKDLIDNFISLISHNLNTPVAKTIGLLDVLKKLPLPDSVSESETVKYLDSIKESLTTATRIQLSVKNTLANTKLEVASRSWKSILVSEIHKDLVLKVGSIARRLELEFEVISKEREEFNFSWKLPFHPSFLENLFLSTFAIMIEKNPSPKKLTIRLQEKGICELSLSGRRKTPVFDHKDQLLGMTGMRIFSHFQKLGLIDCLQPPSCDFCVFQIKTSEIP